MSSISDRVGEKPELCSYNMIRLNVKRDSEITAENFKILRLCTFSFDGSIVVANLIKKFNPKLNKSVVNSGQSILKDFLEFILAFSVFRHFL